MNNIFNIQIYFKIFIYVIIWNVHVSIVNLNIKTNNIMEKQKSNAGRPTKDKDPKQKQMNVMVPGNVQQNESFKEKTRFMSFSQYVNSLIASDLGI